MIYLDNASTTKLDTDALNSMMPFLGDKFGNPSSIHQLGRTAKEKVNESRSIVSNGIRCKKNEIYFTSCGSESNNSIIKGIVNNSCIPKKHVITTQIEHPSVLNTCKYLESKGVSITYLPVDKRGYISLSELADRITNNTVLISVIFANNEIGTIQNIKAISQIARNSGVIFHTDAVQAVCHVEIDVDELGIDAMSASSHKFNGPKGVGFTYLRNGITVEKFLHGGMQEYNMRAGTENVAGIIGTAIAFKNNIENLKQNQKILMRLTKETIKMLSYSITDIMINGDPNNGLPGLLNFTVPNIESEVTMSFLDSLGICVSMGSACSNLHADKSHVLKAIGLSDKGINSSIRISYGKSNTVEDVTKLVEALKTLISKVHLHK